MSRFSVGLDGEMYDVGFAHIRPSTVPRDIGRVTADEVDSIRMSTNGGTVCCIYARGPEGAPGPLAACDYAVCAKSDTFSRRKGRKMAFARALQVFPREDRAIFWMGFHLTEKGGERFVTERK